VDGEQAKNRTICGGGGYRHFAQADTRFTSLSETPLRVHTFRAADSRDSWRAGICALGCVFRVKRNTISVPMMAGVDWPHRTADHERTPPRFAYEALRAYAPRLTGIDDPLFHHTHQWDHVAATNTSGSESARAVLCRSNIRKNLLANSMRRGIWQSISSVKRSGLEDVRRSFQADLSTRDRPTPIEGWSGRYGASSYSRAWGR